jgi:predicted ATPase
MEDLQWADPSTLELWDQFMHTLLESSVLFVGTFRPEFQCKWEVGSHLIQIDLKPLNKADSKAIIDQVAKNLPNEVISDLLSKTDGNPLFIEEVTKLVLESGIVEENKGGYHLKGSLKTLSIPKTLHDSLMARLDQLGPAKKVAQIGATIGREFSYILIKAVSQIDKAILKDYLMKLVKSELLFVKGEIPNAIFTFKHALIQETAYSSLLKKQNQLFHKRIVKNLEKSFPDIVKSSPELLAHHCHEAGLLQEAIHYWKGAGDLAISRSAHSEAINHLNKGLEVLKDLPDYQQHLDDEILFQIALGVPLTALRGYGSIEVEQAYERARILCQQAGDTWQLVPALYGLWRYYLLRGQYKKALELSDQILGLSKSSEDPVHMVVANRAAGSTRFYLGELKNTQSYLEDVFKSDASPEGRAGILLYDVVDAWITARSYASLNYWLLGYPDQAIEQSKKSIAMSERLRHPFSIALSLSFASWLYQFLGEVDKTLECAQKGLRIAEENGFAFWIGWEKILVGWAKDEKGSNNQSSIMREGLETWYATGSKLGSSYFLFLLAENMLNRGNIQEARESLEQAKLFVKTTGERWWEAELYRLEGMLYLASENPDPKKAEECYRRALHIAGQQKAKSLELRAATSLAKLLMNSPRNAEAYSILSGIVDWFKEGLKLPDLLEAKITLNNLSAAEAR